MRIAVTGATGLIGRRLVAALKDRGDDVVALVRDPDRARETLGVEAVRWDTTAGPPPSEALSGADGVVHLAGEPIAQRWSGEVKQKIGDSRTIGTANLVNAIAAADPRPKVLVSTSAAGYYGDRGAEELPETAPPGPPDDFLATLCVEWERAAETASQHGLRVVIQRNGVVLDKSGGALAQMLPAFKAFVGGPVAGGRQYVPWIALEDVVGLYLQAIDDDRWSGPVNAAAPAPATNAELSKALGRALHRPALMPVPGFAVKLLFGEMGEVVLASQRLVPARALELGYQFRRPELDAALKQTLA
jgi:uncharacterized protein (TIGR01777 family)